MTTFREEAKQAAYQDRHQLRDFLAGARWALEQIAEGYERAYAGDPEKRDISAFSLASNCRAYAAELEPKEPK